MSDETLRRLKTRLAEVADVQRAASVLSWDQHTYMPPGGAAARAEQLATLSRIAHERFVDDEVGAMLGALAPWAAERPYDDDDASLVRVTKRDWDRERRIPAELVAERSRTTAIAFQAWQKARAANDYASFRPHLEKVVDLSRRLADALGWVDRPYDALLDLYERDMKTAEVTEVFARLQAELVPLVQAIAERAGAVDDSVLHLDYDEAGQWAFGEEVITRLGYSFERGRQDRSAHPFSTTFATTDVRITTRVQRDQLGMALFGTIHEAGHAMYEQGIAPELERTPLAGGCSLGIHESQSRLWENLVGRGLPFWRHFYPALQKRFPENLRDVSLDRFYRAVNKVEPSLIRVEADEVTYHLHVMLRFEIENDMLEGKVSLDDLPDLWNAKMEKMLGIRPDSDANGVLQDVHWSGGMIGYFPTYTIGTLVSVMLWERAINDVPEIPDAIAAGDFAPLLGWMRDRVHRHGSKFTGRELVERITGSPAIDHAPFMRYAREKYGRIYEL